MNANMESWVESLSSLPNNAIHMKFLDSYLLPESRIFLHPTTGLVTSEKILDQKAVLDYWSNKVFGSNNDLDYSATYPYAISRMYYVLHSVIRVLSGLVNTNELNLVDFATGEGVFLEVVKDCLPNSQVRATEGSHSLSSSLHNKGFDVLNVGLGIGESAYFDKAEVGTLLWTLSCTLNPFGLLEDVYKALPENSYLVVAESSRVLVPFKKSLKDMFRLDTPADIHPNYFSANSLVSLLASCGFQTIYVNRYFDSDVLLVISRKVTSPARSDVFLPADDSHLVWDFFESLHQLTQKEFSKYQDLIPLV